jgi:hypothetical protein
MFKVFSRPSEVSLPLILPFFPAARHLINGGKCYPNDAYTESRYRN